MKLARAHEMQQLDRAAIDQYHIPGAVLMENAGSATVDHMLRELGPVAGRDALLFVGPGNNGGDGMVIARRLFQLGGSPFIVFLIDPQKFKGDAAVNYDTVKALNIPSRVILDADAMAGFTGEIINAIVKRPPWAIIDAIFGTGLQRPLAGHFLEAVNAINRINKTSACPVVAVDIPSGLHADTGASMGAAVQADHTATYGLAKPGHFLHGGPFCGKVHVVDIGIPTPALDNAELKGEAVDRSIMDTFIDRSPSSHKGSYGHLFVLAGSAGKSGAALMCGLGALRVGAGLVTMAVPADLRTVFESNLFEAMTLMLADSRKHPSSRDFGLIMENLAGKSALAIGPGIGTEEETRELVLRLYTEARLPMIIDADGLNILAMTPERIADPPAPRILTPHPGEMGRLTGMSAKEIQADRLSAALEFTAAANTAAAHVTLVLKGAGTVICDPAGSWAINTSGNPGMAAGGMGDVLSGIIGGLLAQDVEPDIASRAGVFVHGMAADRLATGRRFGYLASEVADMVPAVITLHQQQNAN
ncbi:MAG: NAD(P)H-hydrate dehydratase [Desulfobulbaceae bacterium]|nr:NAD(P)H-hydrate dehydratase [Desulfobulbaceae bacterium]